MKNLKFTIILAVLCTVLCSHASAQPSPSDSAAACILMHADSGRVLYGHNERDRRLIASVTKIMTAVVVLDSCELSETVAILPEYTEVEGSSMYLRAGERCTVEELLYGILLSSGNDAALALSRHVGGDEAGFAELMNRKARALFLGDTHFVNPHGLDAEGQYSSAFDLARLTVHAMENPDFARIVSTKTYTCGERSLVNHNKLLWQCSGVIGVKTGYTSAAGRTLVSFCEREGMRLVCVTLCDRSDWADHSALYDWACSVYEYKAAASGNESYRIPLSTGKKAFVTAAPTGAFRVLSERGAELEVRVELPRFVYPGVRKGERAGRLVFLSKGQALGETPLVFTENTRRDAEDRPRLFQWNRSD